MEGWRVWREFMDCFFGLVCDWVGVRIGGRWEEFGNRDGLVF